MSGLRRSVWVLVLSAAGCGGESGGAVPCADTAEALTAALADASAGDTVRACEGTFEASFDVPAGVSLRGAGRDATTLVAPEGEVAVLLQPGADQRSDVSDLSIVWSARAGIVALGAGTTSLSHVDVSTEGVGIGIGADGLASLRLTDVSVDGPVGEMDADGYPVQPSAMAWIANAPAYGVVLVHVGSAEIESLDVRGFAAGGVELVESSATWDGGSVCGVFGTGILVYGGDATIERVDVCDLWQEGRLAPTAGMFLAAGASVTTTELTVTGMGSEGGRHDAVGIVQDAAFGTHDGLVVTGNESGGVRIQHAAGTAAAPALTITGSDLSGNGKGGLIALESSGLVVSAVTIDETALVPTIDLIGGSFDMGDGIQIVRCADAGAACAAELTDIALTDVVLTNNARIGLLVSANNGSTAGISVSGISTSGEGTMLGAITQLATDEPSGWASVSRSGAVTDNDAGFSGTLETVGIIDPEVLPSAELAEGGVGGIVGL